MTTTSSPPREGMPWSRHQMRHTPLAPETRVTHLSALGNTQPMAPVRGTEAEVILPLPTLARHGALSTLGHAMNSMTKRTEALAHRTAPRSVSLVPRQGGHPLSHTHLPGSRHSCFPTVPHNWGFHTHSMLGRNLTSRRAPTPGLRPPHPSRRPHDTPMRTPARDTASSLHLSLYPPPTLGRKCCLKSRG